MEVATPPFAEIENSLRHHGQQDCLAFKLDMFFLILVCNKEKFKNEKLRLHYFLMYED